MKATDLMVGDWVETQEVHTKDFCLPSFKRQVSQIMDICVELSYTDRFGNKCYVTLLYDDIEPIPLTLEIMKANGYDFIESYINYIYDNSEGSYLEMTLNDDGEFVWTINTNEYDITQIKYVHELQHALRLLGIEKEIIL